MRRVLGIVAVSVILLVLLAIAVLVGGDSATFVPPPESVSEGFTRQLAAHRFSEAIPYLTEDLAGRTGAGRLRSEWEAFERSAGRAQDVQGEPGMRSDRSATASALVTTSRERRRFSFDLAREKGLWKIARFSFASAG